MNGVLHCETKKQERQYFMGILVNALLKKNVSLYGDNCTDL